MSDGTIGLNVQVTMEQLRELNAELAKAQQLASQGITIPVMFSGDMRPGSGGGSAPRGGGPSQPSDSARVNPGSNKYNVRGPGGQFSKAPEDIEKYQERASRSFQWSDTGGLFTSTGYKLGFPEDPRDHGFGDRAIGRGQFQMDQSMYQQQRAEILSGYAGMRQQDQNLYKHQRSEILSGYAGQRQQDNSYRVMDNEENRFSPVGYRYAKYQMAQIGSGKSTMSLGEFKEAEYQYSDLSKQKTVQDRATEAAEKDMERARSRQSKEQEKADDYRLKTNERLQEITDKRDKMLDRVGVGPSRWTSGNPSGSGGSGVYDPNDYGQPGIGGAGIGSDPGIYAPGSPQAAAALRNNIVKALPGLGDPTLLAKGFAKGGLYAAGNSAADWFHTQEQGRLTGRVDMQAEARQPGMLFGGLIGAGVGAAFGGFGGIIGGSIGGQVGGMFGEYLAAQGIRDTRLHTSANTLAINKHYGQQGDIRLSNFGDSYYSNSADGRIGRFDTHAINPVTNGGGIELWAKTKERDLKNLYSPQFGGYGAKLDASLPTAEELLDSRATLSAAFTSAGLDPDAKRTRSYIESNSLGNGRNGHGASRWASEQSPNVPGMVIDAGLRYQLAQKDVIKQIAPIAASQTRTGDNAFDILAQFGAEATARWEELNTPMGQKTTPDLGTLREMTHVMQVAERNRSVNQYATRGVAQKQYEGDKSLMSEIDRVSKDNKLPGIYQSETYQKLQAQSREDLISSQDEAQIGRFSIPMTKLEGERARLQNLPFSPGSSYANDLRSLQVLDKEIKTRQGEMTGLRKSGQLSEREELRRTQELEGLQTSATGRLANLSEGMIDRLPAFSAGRPSGFHSYDSLQLVQMQLSKVNHPSRYWGALDGKQAEFQDSFARGSAVPGTDRPWSRMGGLDNAHNMGRMAISNPMGQPPRTGPGSSVDTQISEMMKQHGGSVEKWLESDKC